MGALRDRINKKRRDDETRPQRIADQMSTPRNPKDDWWYRTREERQEGEVTKNLKHHKFNDDYLNQVKRGVSELTPFAYGTYLGKEKAQR